MGIKVLLGDYGHVDFAEPVCVDEDTKERFIQGLKDLFSVVEDVRKEGRVHRLGDKPRFPSRWSKKELALLLDAYSNEELVDRLGRSYLSIIIKRGKFLPEFNTWLYRNNYTLTEDNHEELIHKFMKEKELEKKKKRMERKLKSTLLICPKCGLLHDPEVYPRKVCFRDGETRLRELRVSPEEKYEMYITQPKFRYKDSEPYIIEELLRKCSPEKEEKDTKKEY